MNIFPFFHLKKQKGRKIRPLSRTSRKLLFYGLFAVICQLSFLLFHVLAHSECVEGPLLSLRFAPMLEYALMSLVILFVGVYLIERTYIEGAES